MIRMENQNKYVGDRKNNEAHYLDLVFCTKYHFYKETTQEVKHGQL